MCYLEDLKEKYEIVNTQSICTDRSFGPLITNVKPTTGMINICLFTSAKLDLCFWRPAKCLQCNHVSIPAVELDCNLIEWQN